jgi:D-sedoheptulose 7-phosphate isomerase
MIDAIYKQIEDSIEVKQAVLRDTKLLGQIAELAGNCLHSLRSGGKIIFCGNGGSFADAQHLSAEFTSRFMFDRAPLPSLALGTNSSAISAIGNDYGYEHVFARELQAIAQPRDVFICISTSGNSPNVIAAVEIAKQLDIAAMVWTGRRGGRLKDCCECLCVPSNETARIQECHIMIGHILCGLVETGFFKNKKSGK